MDTADLVAEHLAQGGRVDPATCARLRAENPGHEASIDEALEDHRFAQAGLAALRTGGGVGAPTMGIRPGDRIGGFRLVRQLGMGAQGHVWEAVQESVGRHVALKMLAPERSGPRAIARLDREARALASHPHPGIVTVYERGTTDRVHWLAQELVPGGGTLADLVEECRFGVTVDAAYYLRAARIVASVAEALEAAHNAGVVHRDVKPRNILLALGGTPKLADFGLARTEDSGLTTSSEATPGTFAYMSPEQINPARGGLDHRTDIFSLGLVLYELVGLQRAFDGDTLAQVAELIIFEDPIPLHLLRSTCPRDLELICAKAIEKEPRHRYATAAEFALDLRRFLAGEPVVAAPPSHLRRLRRWMVRHPVRMALAGSALLATGIIAPLIAARVRDGIAIGRLSAIQEHRELVELADTLWPPRPERIDDYKRWLERASRLAQSLPAHRAELGRRTPPAPSGPASEGDSVAVRAETVVDRWWQRQLEQLVTQLEALVDPEHGLLGHGAAPEHGWAVLRRLAHAEAMSAAYAPEGAFGRRWAAALPELRRDVPGFAVQYGLVPLGRDPSSGLWEFWHVASGLEPSRIDGVHRVEETSGIVLVLLLGGEFLMGTATDRLADSAGGTPVPSGERPAHPVTVAPFFVSKYELTQVQWTTLVGSNPSYHRPADGLDEIATLANPVENISWSEAARELSRFELTLPTEAQWEYACRAGSTDVWWTGETTESFFVYRAGNVIDLTFALARTGIGAPGHGFDDGWSTHAPVGRFAPNGFGLFDVLGNVRELCLDGYDDDFYITPGATAPNPCNPVGNGFFVARGGGFQDPVDWARPAFRGNVGPEARGWSVGVRPARVID